MAVTNYFKDAVRNNDVCNVQIMMKDSLLRDPSFQEFAEMEKCAAPMRELYAPHDGEELKQSPAEWNEDYMNLMLTKLLFNFSHERVEHLKKIIRHLYPLQSQRTVSRSTQSAKTNRRQLPYNRGYEEQKRIDQANGNYDPRYAFAGFGAGLAGGVAGAVAAATGAPPLIIAAVTAAAGAATGAFAGHLMGQSGRKK